MSEVETERITANRRWNTVHDLRAHLIRELDELADSGLLLSREALTTEVLVSQIQRQGWRNVIQYLFAMLDAVRKFKRVNPDSSNTENQE